MHTLFPQASLNWRWFDFAAGPVFRYTRFAGYPVLFEPLLAFSVRTAFYDSGVWTAGIRLTNFDDFTCNNLASWFLCLNNRFRVSPRLSVTGELKMDISGNVNRLQSVYGLSFRQGILFTW